MDKDRSDLPIKCSRGIGPKRAELFSRLGINSIRDCLFYLPFRYEDRRGIRNICDVRCGHPETVRGKVISSDLRVLRGKNIKIFEIMVNDGTGIIKGKWFNQPFMKKNFAAGQEVILSGVVRRNSFGAGIVIDNPEYEIATDDPDSFIHTNRIVPFYGLTEKISQKQFRKIMFDVLENYGKEMNDPIPPEIIGRNNLPPLRDSIRQVHFPDDETDIDLLNRGGSTYRKRLSFDELFMFEAGIAVMKKNKKFEKGIVFGNKGLLREKFLRSLPFKLTAGQSRVVDDILKDMKKPHPMHRLLQGDVGCGKTVVALLAILEAVECGYQAALMAPTEILAEQHYLNMRGVFEGMGLNAALLVGGTKKALIESIASGRIDLAVGTHAIIQEGVSFNKLGLVVIDEQHKFGVAQRALLRKKGLNPDVLVMTATPIPRSLALTLYGDLDYSVIDELPPGRKPVSTAALSPDQKAVIYGLLESEIRKGRQAYVVYPAIDESDKISLRSAVRGKESFQRIFPDFRTGLLHGRMKSAEKEAIMASFKKGEIDILVSTTVVEVGVDAPNATVMLVIHAERFGLAQLHQLRGRVGRGADAAHCILIAYEPIGEDARRRLDIMVRSGEGFRIAEEDLAIRGPGEFFGTRQAGMPDLKVSDIVRDIKILETARREAFGLIDSSPGLKEFPFLRRSLEVFWKGKIEFFETA